MHMGSLTCAVILVRIVHTKARGTARSVDWGKLKKSRVRTSASGFSVERVRQPASDPMPILNCKVRSPFLTVRSQELCERPGGLPGLPVPNSPHGLRGRKATLN